jgi:hypothetical protein
LAARFGWELLPTAGIARLTQIPGQMGRWGRWMLGWDAAQNAVQAGRGGWDISQNGLTWTNSLQVVGSLLGLGGNYATWRRLPAGGAQARTPAPAASPPTTQAAVSTETVAARPPTAAPSTPTTRAAVADEAATGVAPQRLTWQQLSPADKRLLNDVLHGRQPHSALGRLSPQQLEAALDYYQATGAAGRGTLPSELIRDFNQARVDFLRTGRGQPPGGVHDFAESWLQRQSPEWLEANRDAVNSLRQAIEKMRRRGGGG